MTKKTTAPARKAADAARVLAERQAALRGVSLPDPALVEQQVRECEAEEAANLAAEAAAIAAEATVKQVYGGPMLALRDRARRGLYQKAPNGQPSCGDEIAAVLGVLKPEYVIRACIAALALPGNPYLHLNIGQQSMNLRNKLRGAMKRGEFGMGVVREAAEDALVEQNAAHVAAE